MTFVDYVLSLYLRNAENNNVISSSTIKGWKMTQGENRMAVKLFVLGLPGSGKSTIARYIRSYARDKGWETNRFNDYAILQDMFLADNECKQFKPVDLGGFDVLDHTVFDTALKVLEQEVNQYFISAKSDEIILIEFARNDYEKAFHLFSQAFLEDAYFLYLDTEIDMCRQRILNRIANPRCDDDYYVSEYIFDAYYYGDNGQCLSYILERDYTIDKQWVLIIDNNCSLEGASKSINSFIDLIVDSPSTPKNTTDTSSSISRDPTSDDIVDNPTPYPAKPMPYLLTQ